MRENSSTDNRRELIHEACIAIGKLTPLRVDCGKLCNKQCCKGDKAGMLLFPGEEFIFDGVHGFHIEEIEYMDVSGQKLLLCDGSCNRNLRPLACRIFPCAPNIDTDNNITVEGDVRGRRMCPL